jgi:hypothetical protein
MLIMRAQLRPYDVATSNEAQGRTKIIQALRDETRFEFNEVPLSDVVAFLKDRHFLEIQIDAKMLEAESIGTDTPVTCKLQGVTLRSALRLMLGALDLTYIVKDEVLLITTIKGASVERMVRIYPVGDLITPDSNDKPDQDFAALIEIIKGTVEPRTWQHTGGADIQPWSLGKSLVIRQTWAGHEEIESLLTGLRGSRNAESLRSRAKAMVDLLERNAHERVDPHVSN